jgi:hypothetical protein
MATDKVKTLQVRVDTERAQGWTQKRGLASPVVAVAPALYRLSSTSTSIGASRAG